MSDTAALRAAVIRLRAVLAHRTELGPGKPGIGAKEEVYSRYGTLFSPEEIPNVTEDEFRSFLLFRNNKHWDGIHRQGSQVCSDMDRLREALSILVDETRPINERLNQLRPKAGPPYVPGLARSVLTAILHVVFPDDYGVWNNTSMAGMQALGVWPEFERGAAFGDRYVEVNRVLRFLAGELPTDLWTLDALWWDVKVEPETTPEVEDEGPAPSLRFGLEKYLQAFLRDNWDSTELAEEWALLEEDDELVGYEYDTRQVGRIDLLAKHRTEDRWLVLELKKDQTSDATVGQVLRYMGWVEERLAEGGQVEGLIIAYEPDKRIRYALTHTRGVRLMRYEVDFRLRENVDVAH